jgi:mannose-6-phosphate isomerase-like protein (cupin superfamily)
MNLRKVSTQNKRRPKVVPPGDGKHLDVQGVEFIYKAIGEDTEGHFAFTQGIVPPQRGVPEHIHHLEDEAFYILEGEFEIECDGELFEAGPGSFAVLPKGLPHRFQNLSKHPGKVLCIQSPSGVEEFFEHMSVLAKEGPPDAERVHELATKYGIEFLPVRD